MLLASHNGKKKINVALVIKSAISNTPSLYTGIIKGIEKYMLIVHIVHAYDYGDCM